MKKRKLQSLRFRSIQLFDKYLVFYRPIANGIQVLHVYQFSRNIKALLRKA